MFSALFGEGFDLCDEALGCEVASTDVVVLFFFYVLHRFGCLIFQINVMLSCKEAIFSF